MQKPKEISDLGLKSGTIDSDLMGTALCRACRGRGGGGEITASAAKPLLPLSPLFLCPLPHYPIVKK